MDERKLLKKIEELRRRMEFEARHLGLNHKTVLKISRKIDKLHTDLLKLQNNSSQNNKSIKYIQDENKDDYIKEYKSIIVIKYIA